MNSLLLKEVSLLQKEIISSERIKILTPLIAYLKDQITSDKPILLNYICTHNSRRSHLSQVWSAIAANYFGFNQIQHYSGGTEATALYPQVAETLILQGIDINLLSKGSNPIYIIKWDNLISPIVTFSKEYNHFFNPKNDFAAIMTCSHADENCPFINGALARIALNYNDPKAFDLSPAKAEKYLERSRQIGTEMFYVYSQLDKLCRKN